MNFLEAVKSGRPFKQKNAEDWLEVRGGVVRKLNKRDEEISPFELTLASAILADDYEIEEPTVTITATQFFTVLRNADVAVDEAVIGRRHLRLRESTIRELARALGLEAK
jgi:hypothetical protein